MEILKKYKDFLKFKKNNFSYNFFQNKDCIYFPCHNYKDIKNFNCIFCFCPFYFFKNCIGNKKYLNKNIKDCSKCTFPHDKNNYNFIINKLKNINNNNNVSN